MAILLSACTQSRSLGDVDAGAIDLDSGPCPTSVCECAAGEVRCRVSDHDPEYCSPSGHWQPLTACSEGQICREGVCQDNRDYEVRAIVGERLAPFEPDPDTLYLTQIRIPHASRIRFLRLLGNEYGGTCHMVVYDDANDYPNHVITVGEDAVLVSEGMTAGVTVDVEAELEAGARYWVGGTCLETRPEHALLYQEPVPGAQIVNLQHRYGEAYPATFPRNGSQVLGVALSFFVAVLDTP